MTINLPLDRLASFFSEHPWPALMLVFLMGVVLPAVWSTRRHAAAIVVLRTILDAVATMATALRGIRH